MNDLSASLIAWAMVSRNKLVLTPAPPWMVALRMVALRMMAVVAAQFRTQAARHEQEEHTEIADQRPQRIRERRRAIAFDQHMADPGEGITGYHGSKGQPWIQCRHGRRQQYQSQRGASKVQCPGAGSAMFA